MITYYFDDAYKNHTVNINGGTEEDRNPILDVLEDARLGNAGWNNIDGDYVCCYPEDHKKSAWKREVEKVMKSFGAEQVEKTRMSWIEYKIT